MRAGTALRTDQALVTFHNQLTEDVQVLYTSDFCYKVKNKQKKLVFLCALFWMNTFF